MRYLDTLHGGRTRRVAVLRALQLGDLLCAIPALRALRAALPDACITLIGLPWADEFVDRFSQYLDSFIEFPGFPGLPERDPDLKAFPSFVSAVQQRSFDLVLQLHGSGLYVNPMIELFAARRTAGFCPHDHLCPDRRLFLEYPEQGHEIQRLLTLMEHIGMPSRGVHLEFPLTRDEEAAFERILAGHGLKTGSYVCIHPGSRSQDRRWSTAKFARVADSMVEAGHEVVFTGTQNEVGVVNRCISEMRRPALSFAGQSDLGILGCLIEHSRLLISNDTGVSHIAAALETPSVVLFTGSDPERWAPLNSRLHKSIRAGESITPAFVANSALNSIASGAAYAA